MVVNWTRKTLNLSKKIGNIQDDFNSEIKIDFFKEKIDLAEIYQQLESREIEKLFSNTLKELEVEKQYNHYLFTLKGKDRNV